MKYYILFSGGYDSTAILLKYCTWSSESNPVNIITCSHNNLDENKMIMEKRSIDKILKHLRKKYFINEIKLEFKSDSNIVSWYGFGQLTWWLGFAIQYIKNDSTFCIGLIRNGTAWASKERLENIFNETCSLMAKKDCNLLFPLYWMEKVDVLNYIEKTDSKILDMVWTCEAPVKENRIIKPCGKCDKCVEISVARYKQKLLKKLKKKDDREPLWSKNY